MHSKSEPRAINQDRTRVETDSADTSRGTEQIFEERNKRVCRCTGNRKCASLCRVLLRDPLRGNGTMNRADCFLREEPEVDRSARHLYFRFR